MPPRIKLRIAAVIIVCLSHGVTSVANGEQPNRGIAKPDVEFSSVPAYGSFDDLRGQVSGVDPKRHGVAVYIFAGGWWSKPTFDSPSTKLALDGSFVTDITTGGVDETATRIAAFVIPQGAKIPLAKGEQQLPAVLKRISVADVVVRRHDKRRRLDFAGLRWIVKSAGIKVGPGPNYFSGDSSNVWVDEQGHLHLRMTNEAGKWHCAEVYTEKSFGYGKYTFSMSTPVDQLDPSVVLGLFTWDDAPQQSHREIDFEFSRWGKADNTNSQFVVQPWSTLGNMKRFNIKPGTAKSTHLFDGFKSSVAFRSLDSTTPSSGEPAKALQSWEYKGKNVPSPGNEKVRINLWLFEGRPPTDKKETEIIVSSFRFKAQK